MYVLYHTNHILSIGIEGKYCTNPMYAVKSNIVKLLQTRASDNYIIYVVTGAHIGAHLRVRPFRYLRRVLGTGSQKIYSLCA